VAELVRRAGRGTFVDGSNVVWSVAEGQKGRRWREVRSRDGVVLSSLLLETFPDRSFAHLELSTVTGLLTLHPEGDGTLHGNAVTASGVHHVVGLRWPAGSVLVVDGSGVAIAAATWFALTSWADRSRAVRMPIVTVSPTLDVRAGTIPGDGFSHEAIDADGLPILADGSTWPLELEAP
jgi:hypothetical protein